MHKTNESGRSMVEMLGVLAIMGILSVGGVAMYSSAMNKHRANEILNELYKRASFVAMRITAGQNADQVSLAEFQEYDDLGYAKFDQGVTKVGENQFKLSLASVPNTSICNQIKASTGTNTSFVAITDNCSAITFNNDLSTSSSSENNNNSSDQNSQNECAGKENGTECQNGAGICLLEECMVDEEDSSNHKDAAGFCLKGYVPPDCTEKVTCSSAQKWTENGCVCENGKFGENCDSNCDGFLSTSNICHQCNIWTTTPPSTTQNECDKCTNRTYSNGKCSLNTCSYGEFLATSTCYSCADLKVSYVSSKEECDKCTNREYINGKCQLKSCPEGYTIIENTSRCSPIPTEVGSCQPKCKWTEWFDVDFPTSGMMGGDIETYENIRAAGGKFCENPVDIECRAENYSKFAIEQIGQPHICSLGPFTIDGQTYSGGFYCRNQDQIGPFTMCFNYEVRVYCCDDVSHCTNN